jgi:hypothetical protein
MSTRKKEFARKEVKRKLYGTSRRTLVRKNSDKARQEERNGKKS